METARRLSILTFALTIAGVVGLPAQTIQTKSIDPANLDTTCAPCQDFFQFADGGWVAQATIPGDQPRWGSFNELQEANYAALKNVLEDAAAHASTTTDPDSRKLGIFYASCMDSARVETDGISPLKPELDRIKGLRGREGVQGYMARLSRLGVGAPFSFHSTPDAKNSVRVIADISQSGLGLPDREYYTRSDSSAQRLREHYTKHIARMFRLVGEDSAAASRDALAVLSIESSLAAASMTRVERRNADSVYHLTRLEELRRATPAVSWTRYFSDVGVNGISEVNVSQPKFLHTVDSLIAHLPVNSWKTYFRWHLLHHSASALSSPFVSEDFRFNSTELTGVKEMRPRWKRCLSRTDVAVGEILGQAYVRENFTPEAKTRALEMVHSIQAEFRNRLAALTWMSESTKSKAYAKLDAMINKIGYPDHWRDYSTLDLKQGSFFLNTERAAEFATARDRAKIGKPLDRTEWGMTPPTVNAYYNASINEIVFPAGIMQPPFFNPSADDAVNFGGMGAVIGHELTHGFDDQGRKFDAQGNLSGWWSPDDAKEFTERADVVARQFDGYVAVDSLRVNGSLTLGENLADFGGLTIAYAAYRRSLQGKAEPAPIDGFTGDQRFFLAWAQIWRQVARPEYARLLLTTDPHSPGRFRTIGPLANMPEFDRAFGCKSGDPMVRGDSVRAQIW